MARKTAPKKRKAPKRGRKPVRPIVSVRLDPRILADVKAEADARGVTLTAVIERRMLAHDRLIRDRMVHEHSRFDENAKVPVLDENLFQGDRLAAWKQIERKDGEAELRRLGYTRIAGPHGALWAEPDALIPASIVKAIQEPKA